jgi:hypothetical protein
MKRLLAKLVFYSSNFSEEDFIFINGYDIPSEPVLNGEEEYHYELGGEDSELTIKMYIKNNKRLDISEYSGTIVRSDGNWSNPNYVGEIQIHHYTNTLDMPIKDENGDVDWIEKEIYVLVMDKIDIRPEYRGKGVFRFLWNIFKQEVNIHMIYAHEIGREFYVYGDFVNSDLGQFVLQNLEKETGAKLLNEDELKETYN